MTFFASIVANAIILFARAITAARAIWQGIEPMARQRIYFANHASHGDFVLIWSVMPPALRRTARPVAARDYWHSSAIRRFIGERVFRSVLIDREKVTGERHPIRAMSAALDDGASLILFPEGTRNTSKKALLPFKAGLYHLAKARPEVDLVPVWIDNLNRVLPKGEVIPLPLICTVTFGAAIRIADDEDKQAFTARAEQALLALAARPQAAAAAA